MVNPSRHIDIHALTLDELTGVVNLYPWYAAARLELCRRMFAMGENAWSQEEFAAQALYVTDRGKFSDLVRGIRRVDCSDKDASALLAGEDNLSLSITAADTLDPAQALMIYNAIYNNAFAFPGEADYSWRGLLLPGAVRQSAGRQRRRLLPLCRKNPRRGPCGGG